MNKLNKQISSVTQGMQKVLGSMNVDQIAKMMDTFEKQFETLDVTSGYMEGAMASSTSSAVPEADVDALIAMVAEANREELKDQFAAVGVGRGLGAAAAAPAPVGRVAESVAAAPAAPKADDAAAPPPPPSGKGGDSGGGGDGAVSSLSDRLARLRRG